MPAPIELSVWQSLWILARDKDQARQTNRAEARVDFHVGYVMTTLLAMMFVALGAWIMWGTVETYASTVAGFTQQFVSLYTEKLGAWTDPIIRAAAFTTMLSTTLTVIDAYPRSLAAGLRVARPSLAGTERSWHFLMIALGCAAGWLIIKFAGGNTFTALIDLITTLAFLTAPVFAFLNYRLVASEHLPEEHRPGLIYRLVSLAGLVFLIGFSALFLWNRFLA